MLLEGKREERAAGNSENRKKERRSEQERGLFVPNGTFVVGTLMGQEEVTQPLEACMYPFRRHRRSRLWSGRCLLHFGGCDGNGGRTGRGPCPRSDRSVRFAADPRKSRQGCGRRGSSMPV